MCPGFVSDCLETLEEIDMECREAFLHAGGKQLRLHSLPERGQDVDRGTDGPVRGKTWASWLEYPSPDSATLEHQAAWPAPRREGLTGRPPRRRGRREPMKLILRWVLNAVALMLIPELVAQVQVDGYASALVSAVLLGFVNAIIRPLLVLITLPITLLTLGLFTLVINALKVFWQCPAS